MPPQDAHLSLLPDGKPLEATSCNNPGARANGSSGGMLLAACLPLPSVGFTADLPSCRSGAR